MLETVKAPGAVDSEAAVQPEQFKKEAVGEKVTSWREKKIHGEFLRQLEEEGVDINGTWNWLKKKLTLNPAPKKTGIQDGLVVINQASHL